MGSDRHASHSLSSVVLPKPDWRGDYNQGTLAGQGYDQALLQARARHQAGARGRNVELGDQERNGHAQIPKTRLMDRFIIARF